MQATRGSKRGIEVFFATLLALAILRVVLQSGVQVPLSMQSFANVVLGCLFLGGPLLALCFAARDTWTRKMAALFFAGGLILHLSCIALLKMVLAKGGIPTEIVNALGQVGLLVWCVGLGALLASLIKDQNIVVPIAIFLACLDMFLVFSPLGLTNVIIKRAPTALSSVALQIPAATHVTSGARVSPGALAGPADVMFLAMFLIAIFRFNMQGRRTVMAVIPTLLIYMLLVTGLHNVSPTLSALPALVPIGTVVLLVNWKEFNLSKDEKISTALVALLGIGLFTWGEFQKPQVVRAESSPRRAAQGSPKSPSSPLPTGTNR